MCEIDNLLTKLEEIGWVLHPYSEFLEENSFTVQLCTDLLEMEKNRIGVYHKTYKLRDNFDSSYTIWESKNGEPEKTTMHFKKVLNFFKDRFQALG